MVIFTKAVSLGYLISLHSLLKKYGPSLKKLGQFYEHVENRVKKHSSLCHFLVVGLHFRFDSKQCYERLKLDCNEKVADVILLLS